MLILCVEHLRHYWLVSVVCLFLPVFLATGNGLLAQETIAVPEPASSDDRQTGLATDQTSDVEMERTLADTVRSMFQEKESPLLHIRWGTRVYLDAPLGHEPAGAGLTLRKAELKLSKRLSKNVLFKLSGNYNKGDFSAGDSFIVYTGWKTAIMTAGVQTPSFSLEAFSASSAISFMEPALSVAALSENRSAAVDFLKRTPKQILNAGWVFYNPRQEGVSEIGQALVARYDYSPIKLHGHENIHLGGSLSYRLLDDSARVRFRSRPEVATSNVYYVDTDSIDDGRSVMRAGLEINQVSGRFSWQSEVLASR